MTYISILGDFILTSQPKLHAIEGKEKEIDWEELNWMGVKWGCNDIYYFWGEEVKWMRNVCISLSVDFVNLFGFFLLSSLSVLHFRYIFTINLKYLYFLWGKSKLEEASSRIALLATSSIILQFRRNSFSSCIVSAILNTPNNHSNPLSSSKAKNAITKMAVKNAKQIRNPSIIRLNSGNKWWRIFRQPSKTIKVSSKRRGKSRKSRSWNPTPLKSYQINRIVRKMHKGKHHRDGTNIEKTMF